MMAKDDLTTAGEQENFEPVDISTPEGRRAAEYRLLKSQPNSLRHRIMNLAELAKRPVPRIEYLVEGAIPKNTFGMAVAPGGSGKTTMMMQLGACMSEGLPWFGLPTKKSKVLLLLTEDPEEIVHMRAHNIATAMGRTLDQLPNFLPIAMDEQDTALMRFDPYKAGEYELTELFNEVRNLCLETGANVLILDALAGLFDGDENKRGHAAVFTANMRKLARQIGGAVILISHPSRSSEDKKNPLSGSTTWHGGARWVFQVSEADEMNPDQRTVKLAKGNYSGRMEPITVTYRDGVFHAEEKTDEIVRGSGNRRADRIMLEGLRRAVRDGLHPSLSEAARNQYAPKMIADRGSEGLKVFDLARAMSRLIQDGEAKVVRVGPPSKSKELVVPKECVASIIEADQVSRRGKGSNAVRTPFEGGAK